MRSAIRMTAALKPDLIRRRQHADDEGRRAHDQDGDQEGVFAADEIAEAAEHQGAERPHQEAGGERQQGEDVAGALGKLAEELGADDDRERTVKVKIVPLEDGAQRRGENDFLLIAGHGPVRTERVGR